MTADQLIRDICTLPLPGLHEAEDLERGNVGIDLELLVRRDLAVGVRLLHTHSGPFVTLCKSLNFNATTDPTVSFNRQSMEVFYEPAEIRSDYPMKMSVILPRLNQIFAWCKQQDLVSIVQTSELDAGKRWPHWHIAPANKQSGKKLKLVRGRSPMDLSAGTHLHFDVKGWFNDGFHVARFAKLFHAMQVQLKGQVVQLRYSDDGSGSSWAPFRKPIYSPNDIDIAGTPEEIDDPRIAAWHVQGAERDQALNTSRALTRGDIEIRIFHSSLNIETIRHWFNLIVHMIEYAESSDREQDWPRFSKQARGTDPEMRKQITSRGVKYAKSQGFYAKKPVPKATKKAVGDIGQNWARYSHDFSQMPATQRSPNFLGT